MPRKGDKSQADKRSSLFAIRERGTETRVVRAAEAARPDLLRASSGRESVAGYRDEGVPDCDPATLSFGRCVGSYFMNALNYWLGLGLEPKDLTVAHIALRAGVVFISALVMARIADKRFLGKMSALDVILGFILASMLARAVNGSAAFFPTLAGGFVLVLLHKSCAALAFHSETFGELVKGCESLIVKEGKAQRNVMRTNHITERDLLEELRQQGNVSSVEEVRAAFIERSGKISVIPIEKK